MAKKKEEPKEDPAANAIGQIKKTFGNHAIMSLSDAPDAAVDGISTGSLSLDLALGGYGFPRGRISEVFGPSGASKTTLTLHAIANAQKSGGLAAFIDVEHALDPLWARKIGVNLDTLLVSQPTYGEEALTIVEMLIKSNAVDIIVIDSVAGLVPRAEYDGEIGDKHVGLLPRLMSQAMRKLTGAIANSKTIVIFINQIREKIGVVYGSPETQPGGRALKFFSSVRIDLRQKGTIKDGEEPIGIRVKAKVVKNKVAPPYKVAEFDVVETCGINMTGDIFDLAVAEKVIQQSGSWYSYGEERLGQGRPKAIESISDSGVMLDEIRSKVLAARGFAE